MKDYDYQQLNDVIHSRIRLSIIAILADSGEKEFTEVKNSIKSTDGNLSANLKKLEIAEYIDIKKVFEGKKPLTKISLTDKGRRAYDIYVTRIQKLLNL